MRNRFNINESEKNRIKNLHGIEVIKTKESRTDLMEGVESTAIFNECLDEEIDLLNDRKLIRELPTECRKWMGYEAVKGILGKKAAVVSYPNHKQNQQMCIANGLVKITKDEDMFEQVMDQIDDIVDCMVNKGADVDIASLKKL